MKKILKHVHRIFYLCIFLLALLPNYILAQSEASGLFLLISPGARAGAMGEAQVAVANDAYATYWNPAGLGFLEGSEIAGMHMKWLPGLTDDMYYEFLAFRTNLGKLGSFGLHGAYLSLGEQIHTGPNSSVALNTFRSYMWYGGIGYSYKITRHSSIGANIKIYQQFLAPADVMETSQDAKSTSYAVDLAYLHRHLFFNQLSFGVMLSNLGPNVKFYENSASDPAPTTLRMGWDVEILNIPNLESHVTYDVSKLLIAHNGTGTPLPLHKSLFQSWSDESMRAELAQLLHNFGVELWFYDILALRAGGFYKWDGNIHMPGNSPIFTYGAGLRIDNYGVDLSYVSANTFHPLNNTLRVSFNAHF